jgi:branched-chain amino acid transport system ATP-binding protein
MALLSEHQQLMSLTKMASGMYRPEALALLKQVGIEEQEYRPCSTLAYGDLKRVELAVALANNPRLMLMDEPTAGMAPKERVELMALTAEIVKERNLSVLFTEHDMDVVFAHADRILVLNRGELIADDTPDNVRNNAEVKAIYLGSETEEIAHA